MLHLVVPEKILFDETTGKVQVLPEIELKMEHSLIAVSRWEAIHEKPFIGTKNKTYDELIDYLKCMTISPKNVSDLVYREQMTDEHYRIVNDYIVRPMTAYKRPPAPEGSSPNPKVRISESIYSAMFALGIPEKWEQRHLNSLIALIEVCNNDNKPSKKMSHSDMAARRNAINKARRAKLGTRG